MSILIVMTLLSKEQVSPGYKRYQEVLAEMKSSSERKEEEESQRINLAVRVRESLLNQLAEEEMFS